MIGEDTRALIDYRMEQAQEALEDADFLFQKDRCRAAINRSYYAMFYAILALLIVSGKGTSKHSGAIALFDRDFVKGGSFDKKYSKWLHAAFKERLRSDYNEMVVISPEEAAEILEHAGDFVKETKRYFKSELE